MNYFYPIKCSIKSFDFLLVSCITVFSKCLVHLSIAEVKNNKTNKRNTLYSTFLYAQSAYHYTMYRLGCI